MPLRNEDLAESSVVVTCRMYVLTRHKDDASQSESNDSGKEISHVHNFPSKIYSLFTHEVDSMISLASSRVWVLLPFCDYRYVQWQKNMSHVIELQM